MVDVLITLIICGTFVAIAGATAYVIVVGPESLASRRVRRARDDLEIERANAERDVIAAKREMLLDARVDGPAELEAALDKLKPKPYNY